MYTTETPDYDNRPLWCFDCGRVHGDDEHWWCFECCQYHPNDVECDYIDPSMPA